jgi:hypothetical protein
MDKRQLKTVLFSLLIIGILVAPVAAIAPPGPPGVTKKTYTIYGYVRKTNGPYLSGALVKIYMRGTIHVGSVYTNSAGYFSFTYRTFSYIEIFKAVASKSGYETNYAIRFSETTSFNMGTISLNALVAPPPEPYINQVHEIGDGGIGNLGIEWFIDWGTPAEPIDEYELIFYWSEDATITSDDAFPTDDDGAIWYKKENLPMTYSDSEYWYKITARSRNDGGWSSMEVVGPNVLYLKYYPVGDAYISEDAPYSNFNGDYLYVRSDLDGVPDEYSGYNSLLTFEVPNMVLVKQATLHARAYYIYPDGHGTVLANSVEPSWVENEVTWDEAEALNIYSGVSYSYDGAAGEWEEWDVTNLINSSESLSIRLFVNGAENQMEGAWYYSKDYWYQDRWPFLEVEYWGNPEEFQQTVAFADDYFTPTKNDAWQEFETLTMSPYWDYSYDAGGLLDSGGKDESGEMVHLYNGANIEHDIFSGYYFDQRNLNIDGAFALELRMAFNVLDSLYEKSPTVECGIELLAAGGDLIAEMTARYNGWWNSEAPYVYGNVGNTIIDWEALDFVSYPSLTFTLLREPYTNKVTLKWYDNFFMGDRTPWDGCEEHVLIENIVQSDAIETVRLKVFITAYEPSNFFRVAFDSVKQIPIWEIGNPEDDNDALLDPLLKPDFESEPFSPGWIFEDASSGSLSEEGIAVDGGYSMYATGAGHWTMNQQLDFAREKVNLDALKSHSIGFSIMAAYAGSESKIRVGIRYFVGSTSYYVLGQWVNLFSPATPTHYRFISVPVTSYYPLPSTITGLEVFVSGVAIDGECGFSAYIDKAVLTRLENTFVPPENNYCFYDGLSIGETTVCVSALNTFHDGQLSRFRNTLGATLIAESIEGYKIDSIAVRWRPYGDAIEHSFNQASSMAILEGNEDQLGRQWTKGDGSVVNAWNTLCGIYAHPLVKYGTSIIIGGIVAAGPGWPISTMISSGFSLSMGALLQPYHREASQPIGDYNAVGHWGYDYPNSDIDYGTINTRKARVDIEIQWDVDDGHADFPPYLLFDFTVFYRRDGWNGAYVLSVTQPVIVFIQT